MLSGVLVHRHIDGARATQRSECQRTCTNDVSLSTMRVDNCRNF